MQQHKDREQEYILDHDTSVNKCEVTSCSKSSDPKRVKFKKNQQEEDIWKVPKYLEINLFLNNSQAKEKTKSGFGLIENEDASGQSWRV